LKLAAAAVILFCISGPLTSAQRSTVMGDQQSLAVDFTYSPTSSHIPIGISQDRRIFTAGVEYTHPLAAFGPIHLDYRAEITPVFRESDPVMVATEATVGGSTLVFPAIPARVIQVSHTPVGGICSGAGPCTPIYPIYGSDEVTYGGTLSPLGARARWPVGRRFAITFAAGAGLIYSSRDIPIDNSAQ
jgi:hypothetical protein